MERSQGMASGNAGFQAGKSFKFVVDCNLTHFLLCSQGGLNRFCLPLSNWHVGPSHRHLPMQRFGRLCRHSVNHQSCGPCTWLRQPPSHCRARRRRDVVFSGYCGGVRSMGLFGNCTLRRHAPSTTWPLLALRSDGEKQASLPVPLRTSYPKPSGAVPRRHSVVPNL
jgi:hypothetical protein